MNEKEPYKLYNSFPELIEKLSAPEVDEERVF